MTVKCINTGRWEEDYYIAIRVDEENCATVWWEALAEAFPAFCRSLRRNNAAVIRSNLWDKLADLPGFEDGPDYAPTPIIYLGEDMTEVACGRHGVFDKLD